MSIIHNLNAAKNAVLYISSLKRKDKDDMLYVIADGLSSKAEFILDANEKDLRQAASLAPYMLDRLRLTKSRINDICEGLKSVAALNDPCGEVAEHYTARAGFDIQKVRVPLGVVGIIYEARPNVTIDVIALCLKSGNAVVLRGGKEALNSNMALTEAAKTALEEHGYKSDFIQLITDTSRDSAKELMHARGYIDVLIPRGSASLINTVVNEASVPVIETGAGNCHAYIHKSADIVKAVNIIVNGKVQRPGVCNSLEKIIIDEDAAKEKLPYVLYALKENGVTVLGCDKTREIFPEALPVSEDDYFKEFLSLKIAVKIVPGIDEAIAHINKHSTKHSEVIIAEDATAAEKFLQDIDSAAVYWNASTRFTDGFEFGMGAEMGISTQKLHVRGPIGLKELTSVKYKIRGNGEIRK